MILVTEARVSTEIDFEDASFCRDELLLRRIVLCCIDCTSGTSLKRLVIGSLTRYDGTMGSLN